MTRIILSGANGAMGRVIAASAADRDGAEIVAGIDPDTSGSAFPVYASASECSAEFAAAEADVIIDFSHPSAIEPLLAFAKEKKLPVVVATTGLSEQQIDMVKDAAEQIPVFYTGNMSLGVNLIQELCKTAARVLGNDFDIEIIEKHHNKKIDAPSGTALMIADSIASQFDEKPRYEYDRHSKRERRSKGEIGIHSVRGGTIVGEHEVIFAGRGEVITITHTAASKEIFATGAINAALFISGRKPGLYSMADML